MQQLCCWTRAAQHLDVDPNTAHLLCGVRQVWDVAAEACQHTLTHHAGKVQAVAWNPAEAPVLLSGAFDQVAALVSGHGSQLP